MPPHQAGHLAKRFHGFALTAWWVVLAFSTLMAAYAYLAQPIGLVPRYGAASAIIVLGGAIAALWCFDWVAEADTVNSRDSWTMILRFCLSVGLGVVWLLGDVINFGLPNSVDEWIWRIVSAVLILACPLLAILFGELTLFNVLNADQ